MFKETRRQKSGHSKGQIIGVEYKYLSFPSDTAYRMIVGFIIRSLWNTLLEGRHVS
jgi:hypothetical protein